MKVAHRKTNDKKQELKVTIIPSDLSEKPTVKVFAIKSKASHPEMVIT